MTNVGQYNVVMSRTSPQRPGTDQKVSQFLSSSCSPCLGCHQGASYSIYTAQTTSEALEEPVCCGKHGLGGSCEGSLTRFSSTVYSTARRQTSGAYTGFLGGARTPPPPPYGCHSITIFVLYSNPHMLIFPCPLNFIVVFSLPN